MLKIVLFKETTLNIFRLSFSLIYLYLIPGYLLLDLLGWQIDELEKMVIGFGIGFGIIGILVYHLDLVIHMKYLAFLLPLIIVGIYFGIKRSKHLSPS
jgi:hypothetical protein